MAEGIKHDDGKPPVGLLFESFKGLRSKQLFYISLKHPVIKTG